MFYEIFFFLLKKIRSKVSKMAYYSEQILETQSLYNVEFFFMFLPLSFANVVLNKSTSEDFYVTGTRKCLRSVRVLLEKGTKKVV